jgi:signal transduction histidine kinase
MVLQRWARARLATKLFLSYLLVVLVGVVTLFVAVSLFAPSFFGASMQSMMQGGDMGGMMGTGNGGNGAQPLTTTADALDAAFRAAMMQALLLAAVLATVAAIGLSLFVSRQIAEPVRRLAAATRRIGAGRYAERVAVPTADSGDELGELAASFNAMAVSLEDTERHRLELVGDVAHELRTPIATLQGYLEGLLDGVVTPSPDTWAKLHTEAGRLRRLVDDLQELSRAEARQIAILPKPVAPETIVEAAVDRVGPQFAEKGVALTVALPTVPRTVSVASVSNSLTFASPTSATSTTGSATTAGALPRVLADPDRAVQVLSNLLTNALRYTPVGGQVTVSATAEERGRNVAFQVSDTGIGIAPSALPHVFERFYRVDKSRSRALGGSGIGLTIAKALVEAMGGQISAESAGVGQGSRFAFTLPIAR